VSEILDCLIIGGGPAGQAAAIYMARFRRSLLLLDGGDSRARLIPRSRNLPGFPGGIHGQDLLDRLELQVADLGTAFRHARVEALRLSPEGHFEASHGGEALRARTVILATGVVERLPDLAGVTEAIEGGAVRICPICDAYEARDQRIAVLGGADHAANEALFLRTYSRRVTLVLAPSANLSEAARRELAEARVEVVRATPSSFHLEGRQVRLESREWDAPRRFDVVYSAFGVEPQAGLAVGLGARTDAEGRLRVAAHQETSVPGLFAAGDVVRGLNQISVAEGEGAVAACGAHTRLGRNPC
jgi:thioredoxin reductase (NADPH)